MDRHRRARDLLDDWLQDTTRIPPPGSPNEPDYPPGPGPANAPPPTSCAGPQNRAFRSLDTLLINQSGHHMLYGSK